MALIKIKELIEIIRTHPDYLRKWENDTSVEEALYIQFDKKNNENLKLESLDYESIDGYEILLDLNKEGKICGIEIT